MAKNKLIFVNIALFAAIVIALLSLRIANRQCVKELSRAGDRALAKGAKIVEVEPAIYDMAKLKGGTQSAARPAPKYLSEIYNTFPAKDTGSNIVESWAKVRPEEKAKLVQAVESQIAQAKEALKINPNDSRALGMLAISESLKKMMAGGFDYKLKE